MREVVTTYDEDIVLLDNVTTSKGYVFEGNKGSFILAKDTDGKFIWVRLTPGKVGKPVNAYDTVKEAIKAKLNAGFEVYEFENAELD